MLSLSFPPETLSVPSLNRAHPARLRGQPLTRRPWPLPLGGLSLVAASREESAEVTGERLRSGYQRAVVYLLGHSCCHPGGSQFQGLKPSCREACVTRDGPANDQFGELETGFPSTSWRAFRPGA